MNPSGPYLVGMAACQGIGLIGDPAPVYGLAVHPIALIVVGLSDRSVDRYLVEIGATQPRQLGVEVGVDPPGEKWVVGEIDTGDHVLNPERHLFGLCEEVVRVPVEDHASHGRDRDQLLWDDLGGVEHIEAEPLRLSFGEDLESELVLGKDPRFDRLPEIAAGVVGIRPGDLDALIPIERVRARGWCPVELDETRLAPLADQPEGVHTEPCIVLKLLGKARSDMSHISMWVDSGISETKSQNVS